jgi:isopenicillin N synthase-like dioxygenase
MIDAGSNNKTISVPIIDLSPWIGSNRDTCSPQTKQEVIDKISHACRHVGFFLIANHSVPREVSDEAFSVSRAFFDLPLNEKVRFQTFNETEYPYGYEQTEQLVQGKQIDNNSNAVAPTKDYKETFSIGPSNPDSGMPLRRWRGTQKLQTSLELYYNTMEDLALLLLELFAIALSQESDFFAPRMDHHMSALRLVHYYPLESSSFSTKEHIVRAGAHTDYGALTILNALGPGLEIYTSNEWISVPLEQDALIINLGDLMQRWTNDLWVSTLHRVSMPVSAGRRYSMAYFVNINGDSLVEPLGDTKKYPPIFARDHLMAKHLASMSSGDMGKDEL